VLQNSAVSRCACHLIVSLSAHTTIGQAKPQAKHVQLASQISSVQAVPPKPRATHMKGGHKSAGKLVITDQSRTENDTSNAQFSKGQRMVLIKFQIGNKTKKKLWYQLMDLLDHTQ